VVISQLATRSGTTRRPGNFAVFVLGKCATLAYRQDAISDERSNLAKLQQTAKFSDPKPRKATVIPIGKGLTPVKQLRNNLDWFQDKF